MTIDEAINYYNNLADDIDKNPLPGDSSSEPRQLADWLEELKIFQELYPDSDVKSSLQKNYEQGWKDAINKCITLARAEIDFESQAEQKRFVEFMKQLKEKKKPIPRDNSYDGWCGY